jgi:hypothetical protein
MPEPTGPTSDAEQRQIVELYKGSVPVKEIEHITGRSRSSIYKAVNRAGLNHRNALQADYGKCEVCGGRVRYVSPLQKEQGLGRFCSRACMGQNMQLPESVVNAAEFDCRRCGKVKPVSEFYTHAKTARGYQYSCKACCLEVRQERAKTPIDPAVIRKWRLAGYGLTPGAHDEMFAAQQGCCAICGREGKRWRPKVSIKERRYFLVIDHDHATGRVRALLCWNCNCGLGHFREDPVVLAAAIRYASEHKALSAA